MKGITRKVDKLGRVVIPKDYRRELGIECGDRVGVVVDQNQIIMTAPNRRCVFCGRDEKLFPIGEKQICHLCLDEISKLKEGV